MERWSQLANDGTPVIIDEISGKSFKSTIRFSQAKYHHIIHGYLLELAGLASPQIGLQLIKGHALLHMLQQFDGAATVSVFL